MPGNEAFDGPIVMTKHGSLLNEDHRDKRTVREAFMDEVSNFERVSTRARRVPEEVSGLKVEQGVVEKPGVEDRDLTLKIENFLDMVAARTIEAHHYVSDHCFSDHYFSQDTIIMTLIIIPCDDTLIPSSQDGRAAQSDNRDSVTLCTIHHAKGLEWDHVFLVRANEGDLPAVALTEDHEGHSSTTGGIAAGIEEERRLCYVGLSRARKGLSVTHTSLGDDGSQREPSRFIKVYISTINII